MFRAWLNSGYKRHAMPQTAHRSNTYMQRGILKPAEVLESAAAPVRGCACGRNVTVAVFNLQVYKPLSLQGVPSVLASMGDRSGQLETAQRALQELLRSTAR